MSGFRDVIGALGAIARRRAGVLAGAILLLAIGGSLAYWPGLMIWDTGRQYGQALSGRFDDWHPPAMEWLWRLWTGVWKGPAPMLLTQLALYAAGFVLLVRWAMRRGERGRAVMLAACALLPLSVALMGEVIKDSLMAGALLCATGLWIGAEPGRGRWRRVVAAALIISVATLRYNAFLAGVPLLVAMAPAVWRDRPVKLAGLAVLSGAVLLSAMPVANRLLQAQRSGVEYSLIIFDLGGITYYSGADAFPYMEDVDDPVAANRQCYSPLKWDSYSEWVAPQCPIHFDLVRETFEQGRIAAKPFWIKAILTHPVAYVRHRLGHWNINAAFLVHREPGRAVEPQSDPNPGNYKVPDQGPLRLVDRLAVLSAHTPLGWPACWMALAFALVVLSPRLPSARQVFPLALSGLLYGLGYGVFSVATDERYYLWTNAATALALALALTDRVDWRRFDRRRLIAAWAPLAVVLALSALWRLI